MERTYLQECFASGWSLERIGRETGLHASTIGYWAKKHNLAPPGASRFVARGAPDKSALAGLAAAGATLADMASQLDRSISTIRYWLDKWTIDRPQRMQKADPAVGPLIIERQCRRHGFTTFRLEGRGYYRCLLCRQERVAEWRRRVKRTLVAEAGGRCAACGYSACIAALQFHHLDPAAKSFSLSHEGVARNLALARAEAAKCVLLCANCHAEVEAGYRMPPTLDITM